MRSIQVTVTLEFDSFEDSLEINEVVVKGVNEINTVLQACDMDISPQLDPHTVTVQSVEEH